MLELKAAGHLIEQQRQFPVIYRGINVGMLIPDLIVDGSVIVDPKDFANNPGSIRSIRVIRG